MAVYIIPSFSADRYDYLALSTDDKPVDCDNASTLLEVDTGRDYIFLDGIWYLQA